MEWSTAVFRIMRPHLITEHNNQQHQPGLPDFFTRFEAALTVEAQAFIDAILRGKPLLLTLADARETTRLAIAL